MKVQKSKRVVVFLMVALLMLMLVLPVSAEEKENFLALLDVGNMTFDPRYDYLEGIIWGLLMYDLSRAEGITLVERQDIERVLNEQRLRLQGIVEDEEEAIRIGDLLGADYLLGGRYVFLGEDVILTLTCTSVADGRTSSFSERGHTENLVHALAEKVVERLTGTPPVLVSGEGNRSIISLKDETPGSVALHSPLVNAEIYVDGDFYGYTTGNMTQPILVEPLSPGQHRIEIKSGRDFGVIDVPEFIFRPWSALVDITSGKRTVLRDETRHFNDIIYRLMKLASGEMRTDDPRQKPIDLMDAVSFIDREGTSHQVAVRILSGYTDDQLMIFCTLVYDGTEKPLVVPVTPDREIEYELAVGKVSLEIDVSSKYRRYEVEYTLERTDIEQNMWR